MSGDGQTKLKFPFRFSSGRGLATRPISSPPHESPGASRKTPISGAVQPRSASISHMHPSGVEDGHLDSLSQHYDDSPQAARRWLATFGDASQGSSISVKLTFTKTVGSRPDAQTSGGCPCMLPVLSWWLSSWFERALDVQREQRQNRSKKTKKASLLEDKDFDWICRCTRDYMQLDHEGLPEGDIVVLIEAALAMCGKVVQAADTEGPLRILKSVFAKHGCPERVFERCLYVLCGILGSVRSSPAHLAECLDLFLSGSGVNVAVQALYGLMQTDVNELEATTINSTRGAIQLIHRLIQSKTLPDLMTDDLLTSLSAASRWKTQEVSEVTLQLCNHLAGREHSISDASDKQFSDFMTIIDIAYGTIKISKPATDKSSASLEVSSSTIQVEAGGESPSPRDHIDSTLERLLYSLTGVKHSLVFSHFVDHAGQQPIGRTLKILALTTEQVSEDQLRQKDWTEGCLAVIQKVICRPDLPSEVRLAAVGVVQNALVAWNCDDTNHRGGSDADEVDVSGTTGILQALSEGMKIETDPQVLEAVVEAAVGAILNHKIPRVVQQMSDILTEVASRESSPEQPSRCSEIAARGLVSIFMQSLNTDKADHRDLAYTRLVYIARSFHLVAEARLAALRLLLRIRCDSLGRIYVSQSSDSEYLAAALCRTDESASKFSPCAESTDDKGTPRSSGVSLRRSRPTPPLWIYPGLPALPHTPQVQPSAYVVAPATDSTSKAGLSSKSELGLSIWLECVIACLQKDPDWETYSYIIVHLGAQLSNVKLLEGVISHIRFIRSVLCEQVLVTSFHEPPMTTGLKKGDVALCVFNALTPLIAYKSHFSRNECDKLVQAFKAGIGSFEGTSRGCIHSLSICCFEMPGSVTRDLSAIVHKIQTNATQSHLSMHILEFFAAVARLPEVHNNLHGDEVRLIFGICVSYIKSMRDRRPQGLVARESRVDNTPARNSGAPVPPFRATILSAIELPQYVTAMAYHTMVFWFLSLRLSERAKHVPWIIKSLICVDNDRSERIEEQSEVFIDMMQRTSFSDLGETLPHPEFAQERDGPISSASWLVGLSIVTVETAGATGLSQITKRQASGTTYSVYQQRTAELVSHHAPLTPDIRPEFSFGTEMLPQHVLLQMVSSCAPTGLASQPLPLPDTEYVKRAVRAFDLNPTVDGTKIGVVFIGPGQRSESEILSNTKGSADFDKFLNGLGTRVKLDGAKFNTQGLRAERDGEYTYAWRDRVTEIVYHVPCMMPTNLEDDPQCTNKKMHIGNDHVNIIFNRSGEAFDFDTLGSQFNYVNIVVTPASRIPASTDSGTSSSQSINTTHDEHTGSPFYQVHALTAEHFPAISPASDPKIISAANLAGFVRLIALNASVFSLAWRDRDNPSDYVSSWRNRLQEIRRLRDRVTREVAAAAREPRRGGALYAGYGKGPRTSLYPEGRDELTGERRAPVVDYETAEVKGGEDKMAELYDFSRWTLPP